MTTPNKSIKGTHPQKAAALPPQPPKPEADPGPLKQTPQTIPPPPLDAQGQPDIEKIEAEMRDKGQVPTPFVSSQPAAHADTTTSEGVDVAVTAEADVVPVHPTVQGTTTVDGTNPVNLGGIIDRDFVGKERDPVYAFAGSMNAQNVYDCDQCGSLVRETFMPAHDRFHGLVNGAMNYLGVQT